MNFDIISEKDAPALVRRNSIPWGVWPTKEELYDMYWNKKMSQRQIADELNYHQITISNMMESYNIIRRSRSDAHIDNTRKYNVNKKFFKTWSHPMSYVLGENVCADGNIDKSLTRIEMSSNDKELLESIIGVMESEHPIKLKKGTRNYIIQINSVEMVQDLLKLGITPNKSLTLEFPDVPEEYLPSFLRGVFDGDGCVSPRKKYNGIYVGISCASDNFTLRLQSVLSNIGIESSLERCEGILCGVRIWSCSHKKFYDFIYSTPGPYLKRKKDIFDKFFIGGNNE